MLERLPSADDGRLNPGPLGYMGELERDVPCAKVRNPCWQLVELEESSAREQVLLAGNGEVSRLGSGGDHEVPRLEHLAVHGHPLRTHEPRGPMLRWEPRCLGHLLPSGRPPD